MNTDTHQQGVYLINSPSLILTPKGLCMAMELGLRLSDISEEEIRDHSKRVTLAKTIAVLQVAYMAFRSVYD